MEDLLGARCAIHFPGPLLLGIGVLFYLKKAKRVLSFLI